MALAVRDAVAPADTVDVGDEEADRLDDTNGVGAIETVPSGRLKVIATRPRPFWEAPAPAI